ncbi:hypothetical protein GNZ12_13730 [Paraburkholderia sp. 1N]|uniref:Spore protein YkvP/CgeB glycosyl transferase-like domain-containing protein n=1 Tax=Paraburkholderia solitsugae TaxID=2675748 RepID=A0ABX2BR91_9BURK|nr:glycosyltransferase family 1 protein [Paraburkholderia solitsugae]NPT42353.1 hypothetical protein [Paraburkholderia solitsugae]
MKNIEPSLRDRSDTDGHERGYVVILTRLDTDRHRHNSTFADELAPGLISHGVEVRCLDYVRDVRQVGEALRDPACLFFICFNGFGSELMVFLSPGDLKSTFACHDKPLFDLMHDCPVHETMAHQVSSKGSFRHLLITDYAYGHLARMLGVENVHFVPSITFPTTLSGMNVPFDDRPIDVLLPVGLSSASWTKDRYAKPSGYKGRIFKEIFEAVTERASDDLNVDPLVHTLKAFQELQMPVNWHDPDVRFLVTSIVDYVKFERRDRLVRCIQHLPVTVIADRDVREVYTDTNLKFVRDQSFPDLIKMMASAKSVICPLPHHSGFHERALSALSAGAVVIAAPNEILETNFLDGYEMLSYGSHEALAALLEDCIHGEIDLRSIASRGREKAMATFPPGKIADIMVSRYRTMRRRTHQA